jgi:hypothetical protein
MKKSISILVLSGLIAVLATSCASESRVVVRERPMPPQAVYVRPGPPPYAGAVWVGEEWAWRRGRYEYVAPHYVHPHRSQVWVSGHWHESRNGYEWKGGYWR